MRKLQWARNNRQRKKIIHKFLPKLSLKTGTTSMYFVPFFFLCSSESKKHHVQIRKLDKYKLPPYKYLITYYWEGSKLRECENGERERESLHRNEQCPWHTYTEIANSGGRNCPPIISLSVSSQYFSYSSFGAFFVLGWSSAIQMLDSDHNDDVVVVFLQCHCCRYSHDTISASVVQLRRVSVYNNSSISFCVSMQLVWNARIEEQESEMREWQKITPTKI